MPAAIGDSENGYVDGKLVHNLTVWRLSKLQRWILDHARKNRLAEHRDATSKGADLYYGEVLAGFYGFACDHPKNREIETRFFLGAGQRFEPEVIGRRKYNAACAAVSRAVARLERRGLVGVLHGASSHWAGISLVMAKRTAPKKKAAAASSKARGKVAKPKG